MVNEVKNIRLQAALGAFEKVNSRPDMDMFGVLMVGKVTRVHHKSGTADVIVIDTNDTFKSHTNNEGRFAARIMQRSAGYNDVTKKPYGTIDPISEGSLVLLSFLNGVKQRPIILGTFPRIDNPENVYPTEYPLMENINGVNAREALKRLIVTPAGTVDKLDGEGNIEKTFVGNSFLVNFSGETDYENHINDTHGGYSHDDLTEKDKDTGETVQPIEESPGSKNGKFLFSHRTVLDGVETFVKVYLSDTGELRISRDNNDGKLSYVELSADGEISLTKQNDNPRVGMATDISEVRINKEGDISMRNGESELKLSDDFYVRVPGKIKMYEGDDDEGGES